MDHSPEETIAATLQSSEPHTVSLTDLPDVCLVKILSFLDLPDRLNTACTSKLLHEMFNHPSLWYKAVILISGGNRLENDRETAVDLALRNKAMIDKFGQFFQDLTLVYYGHVKRPYPEVQGVFNAISKSCRLESLILDVGAHLTAREMKNLGAQITSDQFEPINNLISTLYRLHSFAVKSWPYYPGVETFNLLTSLSSNPRIQNLEKLNLFWQDPNPRKITWVSKHIIGPKPEAMESFFQGYFKNLTHLGLRSSMLNESVLLSLSDIGRTPLKSLKIMVVYSKQNAFLAIPHISSDAWRKLTERSPGLEIEVSIVTRVPNMEIANLLKPETPLVAISYLKFAQCSAQDLTSITDKYFKILKKFISLCHSENIDSELVAMVTMCSDLQDFCYHGQLNYRTAVAIANLRGENWKQFELVKTQIDLFEQDQNENNDEVIRQAENGKYYIVSLERELYEQNESISIEHLNGEVSAALERTWNPLEALPDEVEEDNLESWKAIHSTSLWGHNVSNN